MDTVPVPDLDGKATGAFLVKDIRRQCRSFLDSLGSMLMDSEDEQDQHGVKTRKINSEFIQEYDTDVITTRKNARKRRKTSKGAGFGDGAKGKKADTADATNEGGKKSMENNIEDLKLESEVEALRRLKAGLESKGDSGNEFIRTTMEGERVEISGHQLEANNRIVECYMHTKEHVDEQYKTLIHEMQEERKSQYEQALKILRSLHGQSKTLSVRSRLKERLPPQETPNDKHKESRKDSSRPLPERREVEGDLFHDSQPSSNFGLSSGSDQGREPCIGPTNSEVTAKSRISGEIVVHLTVYLPQAPSTPGEEWLVLGSQPLTLLRDALYCLIEQNMRAVEEQENASRLNGLHQDKLRLVENSSYFYFEGTFYIDRRESNVHDLSRSLRSYLAAENIAAPPHPVSQSGDNTILSTSFSTRPMEETLFEDLYIRLGSGVAGLYCHLGGCEHLVVVKDVRMHNPDVDPSLTSQYPYQIRVPSRTLVSLRYCEVCDRHAAQKVTYEDKKAPHTPFFWCNECFRLMHYDAQGHAKYTDYKVFPYLHDYQANLLHGHAYFKGRNTLQTDLERRETDP